MLQFQDVVLQEIDDVSHMIKHMSVDDREKLSMTSTGFKLDFTDWNDLFLIKTKKDKEISEEQGYIYTHKNIKDKFIKINQTYILPEHRRKQLGLKATIAVMYYCFDYLCYEKFETEVHGFNIASMTGVDKYLKKEGEKRSHQIYRGKRYSYFYYGMLREEFLENELCIAGRAEFEIT